MQCISLFFVRSHRTSWPYSFFRVLKMPWIAWIARELIVKLVLLEEDSAFSDILALETSLPFSNHTILSILTTMMHFWPRSMFLHASVHSYNLRRCYSMMTLNHCVIGPLLIIVAFDIRNDPFPLFVETNELSLVVLRFPPVRSSSPMDPGTESSTLCASALISIPAAPPFGVDGPRLLDFVFRPGRPSSGISGSTVHQPPFPPESSGISSTLLTRTNIFLRLEVDISA